MTAATMPPSASMIGAGAGTRFAHPTDPRRRAARSPAVLQARRPRCHRRTKQPGRSVTVTPHGRSGQSGCTMATFIACLRCRRRRPSLPPPAPPSPIGQGPFSRLTAANRLLKRSPELGIGPEVVSPAVPQSGGHRAIGPRRIGPDPVRGNTNGRCASRMGAHVYGSPRAPHDQPPLPVEFRIVPIGIPRSIRGGSPQGTRRARRRSVEPNVYPPTEPPPSWRATVQPVAHQPRVSRTSCRTPQRRVATSPHRYASRASMPDRSRARHLRPCHPRRRRLASSRLRTTGSRCEHLGPQIGVMRQERLVTRRLPPGADRRPHAIAVG